MLLFVALLAAAPAGEEKGLDPESFTGIWAIEETDAYGTSQSTWEVVVTEDSLQIRDLTYVRDQAEPRAERLIVRDYEVGDDVLGFTIVNSSTWKVSYRLRQTGADEWQGEFHSKDDFAIDAAPDGAKLETRGIIKATRKPKPETGD